MDPISEMIACFRSWLPEVRVLGNVQAGPAADALESLRSECDRYREALVDILANEEAYNRGDALSAHIARSVLDWAECER